MSIAASAKTTLHARMEPDCKGVAILTADAVLRGLSNSIEAAFLSQFFDCASCWVNASAYPLADAVYGWNSTDTLQKRLKRKVFSLSPILVLTVHGNPASTPTATVHSISEFKHKIRERYGLLIPTVDVAIPKRSRLLSLIHAPDTHAEVAKLFLAISQCRECDPPPPGLSASTELASVRNRAFVGGAMRLYRTLMREVSPGSSDVFAFVGMQSDNGQMDQKRIPTKAFDLALEQLRASRSLNGFAGVFDWRNYGPSLARDLEPVLDEATEVDCLDKAILMACIFENGPFAN